MDQIEVSNLIEMNVRFFTDLYSKKQSDLIPKKNYIIMLKSHIFYFYEIYLKNCLCIIFLLSGQCVDWYISGLTVGRGWEGGVYDYDLYGLLPDGHYCCQVTAILSLSQSVVSPRPE